MADAYALSIVGGINGYVTVPNFTFSNGVDPLAFTVEFDADFRQVQGTHNFEAFSLNWNRYLRFVRRWDGQLSLSSRNINVSSSFGLHSVGAVTLAETENVRAKYKFVFANETMTFFFNDETTPRRVQSYPSAQLDLGSGTLRQYHHGTDPGSLGHPIVNIYNSKLTVLNSVIEPDFTLTRSMNDGNVYNSAGVAYGVFEDQSAVQNWVRYDAPYIDPLQWNRKLKLTTQAAPASALDGFTGLITHENLPAEIFTRVEKGDVYIPFNGLPGGNFGDFLTPVPLVGNFRVELDIILRPISTSSFDIKLTDGSGSSAGLRLDTNIDRNANTKNQFDRRSYAQYRVGSDVVVDFSPYYETRTTVIIERTDDTVDRSDKELGTLFARWSRVDQARVEFYSAKVYNASGILICHIDAASYSGSGDKIFDSVNSYDMTLDNFTLPAPQEFSDGGGDLRLCLNEDGTGRLPLEIVEFDEVAQRAALWTRLPELSAGAEVWLFYDKTGESQPAVDSPFGRNAVWSDYEFVSHNAKVDSTGNHLFSSVASPLATDNFGKIDGASFFDDVTTNNGYSSVTIPATPTLTPSTYKAWAFNDGGSFDEILGLRTSHRAVLASYNSNKLGLLVYGGGFWNETAGQTDFLPEQWHRVAGIVSAEQRMIVLNNGNPTINNALLSGFVDSTDLQIGRGWNGRIAGAAWKKSIDTVEMLHTEYANQSSPATFWTTGSPADTAGGGGGTVSGITAFLASSTVASSVVMGRIRLLAAASASTSTSTLITGTVKMSAEFASATSTVSLVTTALSVNGQIVSVTDTDSNLAAQIGLLTGFLSSNPSTSSATSTMRLLTTLLSETSSSSDVAAQVGYLAEILSENAAISVANGMVKLFADVNSTTVSQTDVFTSSEIMANILSATNTASAVTATLQLFSEILGQTVSLSTVTGKIKLPTTLFSDTQAETVVSALVRHFGEFASTNSSTSSMFTSNLTLAQITSMVNSVSNMTGVVRFLANYSSDNPSESIAVGTVGLFADALSGNGTVSELEALVGLFGDLVSQTDNSSAVTSTFSMSANFVSETLSGTYIGSLITGEQNSAHVISMSVSIGEHLFTGNLNRRLYTTDITDGDAS